MTYEALAQLAEECGFTAWSSLDVATISLKQEVRDMCASGTCHQYGKRWSCPPGCGSLQECEERLRAHQWGILVQTKGEVEDGFDFEAMMEIEAQHKKHFEAMQEKLSSLGENALPIGAGCCTRCGECTYPDAPCRFPEKMVSSMEAYGMLVMEICKANGLEYYYGSDHMAYTSCFLL